MDTFLLVLRVGLSLAVVVVLLLLAQKRWAKGGRAVPGSDLEVLSRRSVGQKAHVVMVDANGQRFLLGVTEHSINVLHSAPAPVPEPVFEESLDAAKLPEQEPNEGAPRRLRARHQNPGQGALAGSILSLKTWQQAGSAVRKGLNL
ncbi:FliO/MopB family protein [Arthrobacter cryoconiti]|uniref:FliO/MopB family protein n=1 Tax=Arthrobacter cryoconiti TaxID=748907 RepID=A0ABV8QZU1_9MICC|nr:flagellar biosynthetic protein FliO [Arthrobacter cryoconiti]MCC9067351.1 flagellar biosynthetic protein FliO [Arthrobacter cryoconiti]